MRKALKFVGFLVFVLILFVAVASLAFYHLIREGEFRRFLISEIEKQTELKVQLGEVDLYDHFTGARPATTRLRNVDLEVQRISGVALREFFQKLVRPKTNQPHGPALQFDLRTGVERDGQQTQVRAKGTLVFPGEQLELTNAWWNAETWITDVPAPMIQAYTGRRLPVKSISGTLNSQLHVEGSMKERLHLKGELAFRR